MMSFARVDISGWVVPNREFIYEIGDSMLGGPALYVSSIRVRDGEDKQREFCARYLDAAQAEQLANAFAELTQVLREHEAERADREGEPVAQDSHGVQSSGHELIAQGGE